MKFTRSGAVALRYFYLLRDNWIRVFQIFIWATLDIILWGFITKYLDDVGGAVFSFTTLLLSAVTLWAFMTRAMQGITTPFLEDVWSRNLLNMFGSPLSVTEYILGLSVTSICTSVLGLIFMLLLASAVFGLPLISLGLPFALFVLLLFVFGVALGILGICIVLMKGPAAEWFVWPLPTVLTPLVGVYYPISVLPTWLQYLSEVIPATHVFEGLRGVIERGTVNVHALVLASVLDAVFLALSWALFVFVYRRAVRSGAIARYSAESFQ